MLGQGEEGLELHVYEPLDITTQAGGTEEVPCAHGDGAGVTDATVVDSLAQGGDGNEG